MDFFEKLKAYYENHEDRRQLEYIAAMENSISDIPYYMPIVASQISDPDLLNSLITFMHQCKNNKKHSESINQEHESESWIVKTSFSIVERLAQTKDTAALQRTLELLEDENITTPLLDLMARENTKGLAAMITEKADLEGLIVSILEKESENATFLKNATALLQEQARTRLNVLVKYIPRFIQDNSYQYRLLGLDLAYQVFAETKNLEAIGMIRARLLDVSIYVRARAVSLLNFCLENQGKMDIDAITDVSMRITDKSTLVRKKCIVFMISLLTRLPSFGADRLHIESILEKTNSLIISVFPHIKTEIAEILEYAKISYFYGVPGSKKILIKLINCICMNNSKDQLQSLLSAIRDILKRSRQNKERYLRLLEDIRETGLTLKYRLVDVVIIQSIFDEFMQRMKIFIKHKNEEDTVHKRAKTGIEGDISVIQRLSEILSGLRSDKLVVNEPELTEVLTSILASHGDALPEVLQVYRCMLTFMLNNNFKADKGLINALTFGRHLDLKIIDLTIRLIYSTDVDYVYYLLRVLKRRCRLIYALGAIAINHSIYLDRLKKDRNIKCIKIPDDIKDRRRSFNSARMSISLYDIDEFPIDEQFYIDKKKKPQTKTEEPQPETEEQQDNPCEDIEDMVFYIKESEMLYDDRSLLKDYIPLVLEGLSSEDKILQRVSQMTLFKFMCLSSEFFLQHFDKIALDTNSMVALADFMFLYNPLAEKISNRFLQFDYAMFLYLTTHKIMKLKSEHLLDIIKKSYELKESPHESPNSEYIGQGKHFIQKFLSHLDENQVSFLFYECLLNSKGLEFLDYLVSIFKPLLKEKSKQRVYKMAEKVDKKICEYLANNLLKTE